MLGAINFYDDHEKASIRKAVVNTSISIMDKVIGMVEPFSEEFSLISKTTERLLMMGIGKFIDFLSSFLHLGHFNLCYSGDEDFEVRVSVFNSLKNVTSLDSILSKTRSTQFIVEALNDEIIDIKIAAISVLSRLCHYHSMHIMPFIRLVLGKLLRLVKISTDVQLRQESVELILAIVTNATTQMIPYAPLIFESIMDLLNDPQLQTESRGCDLLNISLSTIGELSIVSPESIQSLDLQKEVFDKILWALEDHSSPIKQEISVIALGKIVRSLGLVSEPYNDNPSLFELLINVIQRKDVDSPQLRLQAIKTAGLLGVIEQDQFERFLLHNADQMDQDNDVEGISDILTETEVFIEEESLDKYSLSVVIRNLMKILRDDALSQHHLLTVTVAVRIIRILGNQSLSAAISVSEDSGIMSGILYRLKKTEHGSTLQEALLEQITIIVHVIGRHLSNEVEKIAKVCSEFFEIHLQLKLNLIESLVLTVTGFNVDKVLGIVIPCFVETLKVELSTAVEEIPYNQQTFPIKFGARHAVLKRSSRILLVLANVSSKLGGFKFQVLQPIVDIMTRGDIHFESRSNSMKTLVHIAINSRDFRDCACTFVHPLIRVLDDDDDDDDDEINLRRSALSALSVFAVRLESEFLPFVLPIRRKCLHMYKDPRLVSKVVEYESTISFIFKTKSKKVSVNLRPR